MTGCWRAFFEDMKGTTHTMDNHSDLFQLDGLLVEYGYSFYERQPHRSVRVRATPELIAKAKAYRSSHPNPRSRTAIL